MAECLKIIACFDDGVAQSISQLEIMGAIMDQVRRIRYPDKPDQVVLPREYISVIGGTGTGGLIAIMLTRLEMSVAEAITELRIIIDEVYANKLEPADKTNKLRDCIEGLLTKRNLPINLELASTLSFGFKATGFVITERMSDGRKVSLDYRVSRLTIVEAVLATCASQPEFLPVTLDWEPGGPYQYVGPGRGASNPVYQIITESLHTFPIWSRVAVLLSLGSGNPGIIPFTRSHYSGSNALQEQQDDMAKDDRASKILKQVNEFGGYFRFSLQQEPQGRDLDFGIDEPSRAAAQTDLYLHNPDTARRIEDCAKAIFDCSDIGQKLVSECYTAGDYEVAEMIQVTVKGIRRKHAGPTHPDTIRASELLLMIYIMQFKLTTAHRELAELLGLYRDMLGADHPRAIEAAAGLAAICSELGDWDRVENLQLEILEQTRRVLGKDHLDAILAAANLASTYHGRGRWDEARQLWLEVLEGRQRVLGEDHPNTVFAAECLDASFRAPKEAETARRWKLSLTRPLEEAANSSLGAIVDAESDSSYPHASLNAYTTRDASANSGTKKIGGQSQSVALDTNHDNSPQSDAPPSVQTQLTEGWQKIVEAVHLWYNEAGPLAKDRSETTALPSAGHSYRIQLIALNFKLAETSMMVDRNSTFSQIGFLLHTLDATVLPVVLEQTPGPFPRWRIPNINSRVPRGAQKVYVADINTPFTLALVRDVDEDFPLLLPFPSFNSSATSVSDLIGSNLGGRAKTWASIRLLSSLNDIQKLPCDMIRKEIKGTYSTTIFVLLSADPLTYKFRNDHDHPSPLPLKMAFLQCQSLVGAASHMESFALQAIHLSRALLHLIIRLAEAVNLSSMEEPSEAYHISKLKMLVVKLKSIFADIEGLTDATFESVKTSLVEFYDEICEERPGVVAVRQSLKSLQALTVLDLRNQGKSFEISDGLTIQEEDLLEQDLGTTYDVTSERPSDSSDSMSSSGHESDGNLA